MALEVAGNQRRPFLAWEHQAMLMPLHPELLALLKLSTEVVERIVWEVVPELAEAIIRENLQDLTARKQSS